VPIEENEVYTTKEVAALLKVSLPTVKRMLKDGRLKSRRIGRQHRFLGRDLIKILSLDGVESEQDSGGTFDGHKQAPPPRPDSGRDRQAVTPQEKRQRDYMLGKRTSRALMDNNNRIIFDKGVVVTEEVIEKAVSEKKLTDLFACLEHEQ